MDSSEHLHLTPPHQLDTEVDDTLLCTKADTEPAIRHAADIEVAGVEMALDHARHQALVAEIEHGVASGRFLEVCRPGPYDDAVALDQTVLFDLGGLTPSTRFAAVKNARFMVSPIFIGVVWNSILICNFHSPKGIERARPSAWIAGSPVELGKGRMTGRSSGGASIHTGKKMASCPLDCQPQPARELICSSQL